MKIISAFLVVVFLSCGLFAQEKEIPYTLADRDRLIRVEAEISSLRNEMVSFRNEINAKIGGVENKMDAKIEGLENKMDAKIEGLRAEMDDKFEAVYSKLDANSQRISDQQTLLYWGFGILFSMMLFMLGYNIWDRRTMMTPMKERQDKIIQILKMADEDNISFREALKRASLW